MRHRAFPRAFALWDGRAVIAEGVEFTDGTVALRWRVDGRITIVEGIGYVPVPDFARKVWADDPLGLIEAGL